MREDEIRRLVKIVEESNIGALEISRWGRTIKITRQVPVNSDASTASHSQQMTASHSQQIHVPAANTQAQKTEEAAPEATQEKPASSGANTFEIKSPMVGTFYRSPSPDAEPYVDMNQTIKKGQVLCIIEAMKLMNEIESEVDGRIVEILVENAQPVEYNQPLFLIEPA